MKPEIARARSLRAQMSEPEVILWSRLKRLRSQGYHFRRQAPFRGYYLDFVCYPRRLVVEVDGSQHGDDRQADHDAVRDAILRRHGFLVQRFWASDVRRETSDVIDQIVRALEAAPLAHGRGGQRETPRLGATSPP
jgi:very-short-patch-repair endonuclease